MRNKSLVFLAILALGLTGCNVETNKDAPKNGAVQTQVTDTNAAPASAVPADQQTNIEPLPAVPADGQTEPNKTI